MVTKAGGMYTCGCANFRVEKWRMIGVMEKGCM